MKSYKTGNLSGAIKKFALGFSLASTLLLTEAHAKSPANLTENKLVNLYNSKKSGTFSLIEDIKYNINKTRDSFDDLVNLKLYQKYSYYFEPKLRKAINRVDDDLLKKYIKSKGKMNEFIKGKLLTISDFVTKKYVRDYILSQVDDKSLKNKVKTLFNDYFNGSIDFNKLISGLNASSKNNLFSKKSLKALFIDQAMIRGYVLDYLRSYLILRYHINKFEVIAQKAVNDADLLIETGYKIKNEGKNEVDPVKRRKMILQGDSLIKEGTEIKSKILLTAGELNTDFKKSLGFAKSREWIKTKFNKNKVSYISRKSRTPKTTITNPNAKLIELDDMIMIKLREIIGDIKTFDKVYKGVIVNSDKIVQELNNVYSQYYNFHSLLLVKQVSDGKTVENDLKVINGELSRILEEFDEVRREIVNGNLESAKEKLRKIDIIKRNSNRKKYERKYFKNKKHKIKENEGDEPNKFIDAGRKEIQQTKKPDHDQNDSVVKGKRDSELRDDLESVNLKHLFGRNFKIGESVLSNNHWVPPSIIILRGEGKEQQEKIKSPIEKYRGLSHEAPSNIPFVEINAGNFGLNNQNGRVDLNMGIPVWEKIFLYSGLTGISGGWDNPNNRGSLKALLPFMGFGYKLSQARLFMGVVYGGELHEYMNYLYGLQMGISSRHFSASAKLMLGYDGTLYADSNMLINILNLEGNMNIYYVLNDVKDIDNLEGSAYLNYAGDNFDVFAQLYGNAQLLTDHYTLGGLLSPGIGNNYFSVGPAVYVTQNSMLLGGSLRLRFPNSYIGLTVLKDANSFIFLPLLNVKY